MRIGSSIDRVDIVVVVPNCRFGVTRLEMVVATIILDRIRSDKVMALLQGIKVGS